MARAGPLILLMVLAAVTSTSVAAAAQTSAAAAEGPRALLDRNTRDLERNTALGAALSKRPGTPAEMRELQELADGGLSTARELAAKDPESAEASYLLGSWLIYGYRVARTRQVTVKGGVGGTSEVTTRVVQGLSDECEEGLSALQRAIELDALKGQYVVDYGAALVDCGEDEAAKAFLKAAWTTSPHLTAQEKMQVGLMLSDISEREGDLTEAREWVYAALEAMPKNTATTEYLRHLDQVLPQVEVEAAAEAAARAAEAEAMRAAEVEPSAPLPAGEVSAPAASPRPTSRPTPPSPSARRKLDPSRRASPEMVRQCPFDLVVGSGITLAAGTTERSLSIPLVDYAANTVTQIDAGRWSIVGAGRRPLRLQMKPPVVMGSQAQRAEGLILNVLSSSASQAAVFGDYLWQEQPFEVYLDGALVGSFANTAAYRAARGK